MSLPDEIRIVITTEGMIFELAVRALPQGCARLFPELASGDEFRLSPDLPVAVVQVAASALDVAVSLFLAGFQASLSGVLVKILEKVPADGSPAAQPEQEAA